MDGIDFETVRLKSFPFSDILCYGKDHEDRTCRLKNVCFDNDRTSLVFFRSPVSSWLGNIPGNEERNDKLFYDYSTLVEYKPFLGDINERDPRALSGRVVEWVSGLTILHSRVLPTNIMHFFHDDFVGLFDLLMEFTRSSRIQQHSGHQKSPLGKSLLSPWLDLEPAPFDKNTRIFFYDDYYSPDVLMKIPMHIYSHLTEKPILLRGLLAKRPHMTCFSELLVGPSKRNTWYEYGLRGKPQGPIMTNINGTLTQKNVDGLLIRRMTEHIMAELQVAPLSIKELRRNRDRYIVLFSRSRNRRILNEQQLADHLSIAFSLPVRIIQIESNSFVEMVKILSRAILVIGMHGSALIMSMFLPPGAVLLELFPLAVPAKGYTPYKTLANLPGMNIVYGAWENKHKDASVANKSWIAHLSTDEQEKIVSSSIVEPHLCCEDPSWIYHIYQDTRVNLEELTTIIKLLLKRSPLAIDIFEQTVHGPSPLRPDFVIDPKCLPRPWFLGTVSSGEHRLSINWKPPWNIHSLDVYYELLLKQDGTKNLLITSDNH